MGLHEELNSGMDRAHRALSGTGVGIFGIVIGANRSRFFHDLRWFFGFWE